MVKIVWKDYVLEQMHWAERLFVLATDTDNTLDSRMLQYAERALENAQMARKAPS
ncbi:MAG: hypothetical protein WD075_13595 [Rhodospirillales bacterium]